MFKLRKTKRIEASHKLPNHDGKCRNMHGHTWSITVEVEGGDLNEGGSKDGMLLDYYDIGELMKEHVESLDHKHLNDLYPNPTSEVIAKDIFLKMMEGINRASKGSARLCRIIVSETQDSSAEYSG